MDRQETPGHTRPSTATGPDRVCFLILRSAHRSGQCPEPELAEFEPSVADPVDASPDEEVEAAGGAVESVGAGVSAGVVVVTVPEASFGAAVGAASGVVTGAVVAEVEAEPPASAWSRLDPLLVPLPNVCTGKVGVISRTSLPDPPEVGGEPEDGNGVDPAAPAPVVELADSETVAGTRTDPVVGGPSPTPTATKTPRRRMTPAVGIIDRLL